MDMTTVFDAKSYRDFLTKRLDSESFSKGGRTRLAAHLGVHNSFVSTVLSGRQEFSPEHGIRVAEFFGLDDEERDWLILLICVDRAGSEDLKRYWKRQLEQRRSAREKIQAQIETKAEVNEGDLVEYYGAWHTIVIHMCVRNPKLRDPDSIARVLRLNREVVLQSLKKLEKIGFVKELKGRWIATDARFHVGRFSPALRAHLGNWRNMAIHAIDERVESNLHYSLVMSVDDPAVVKIRALLLELIKKVEPVIQGAQDDRVLALNLDFFEIGKF